jgi:hypothetical protein
MSLLLAWRAAHSARPGATCTSPRRSEPRAGRLAPACRGSFEGDERGLAALVLRDQRTQLVHARAGLRAHAFQRLSRPVVYTRLNRPSERGELVRERPSGKNGYAVPPEPPAAGWSNGDGGVEMGAPQDGTPRPGTEPTSA